MSGKCRDGSHACHPILRAIKKARMKAPIALTLLFLLAFHYSFTQAPALPPNQLSLPAGSHTLPLAWKGDSLHGRWEPYAALLVPITLPGCPRRFYLQFDTGSPYTLFYRNKLTAIHRQYPATTYLKDVQDTLTGLQFRLGSMPVNAGNLPVQQFDSSGIDWKDKNNLIIIGTLGADIIEHKAVMLDYPGLRLQIADSLPANLKNKLVLTDFMFMMRRILLPVMLLGKKTVLYFDTGSSAFTLLTSQATCYKLATDSTATPVQYPVNSWNKTMIANTIASAESIRVANHAIPLQEVTWIEGVSAAQVNQMMKMGMGGMTGNKLFLHYTLVLDTRNKQFGLIKK
jgi:hypothetical protein